LEKIPGLRITWDKLDCDIKEFVRNKKEKEITEGNIDVVLPFKRGGSIFSQLLIYHIEREKPDWNPVVRDIPHILKTRKKSAEFLNRYFANPDELRDIPLLMHDLNDLIDRSKKLRILFVDDNITTAKRIRLFSKILKSWFGERVIIQKLVYCKSPRNVVGCGEKYLYVNKSISQQSEYYYVLMPWKKEIETKMISRKANFILEWGIPGDFDIHQLFDRIKQYQCEIYRTSSYSVLCSPMGFIFSSRIKHVNGKETITIRSGSLHFGIYRETNSLKIKISSQFSSIPYACSQEKCSIDERYRVLECKRSSTEDSMCLECHILYASRDIIYLVSEEISRVGADPRNVSLYPKDYDPYFQKYLDSLLTDRREELIQFMVGDML
jgi:hypothetical protein